MNKYQTIEQIVEKVKERARTSFVTPTFGDNWKTFTKEQYQKGEIEIDEILDIAWFQGRRAHLLERELANVLDSISQDDLQLDKIIEGESTTLRDEIALKALDLLPFTGAPLLTATDDMIAKRAYSIADAMIREKKIWEK